LAPAHLEHQISPLALILLVVLLARMLLAAPLARLAPVPRELAAAAE
jgi:hypothetical protein